MHRSKHDEQVRPVCTPRMLTDGLPLCRVEANKFADWTQEEFEALVLPNRHSDIEHPTLQSMQQQGASIRLHQPVLTKTMLPSTVDWRGTPADSAVKDQAACGSCWVSLLRLCFPLLAYVSL